MSPFDPRFEDLPRVLPVFPLTGVLLLPRGRLPLNIFEPRYLNMTDDALRGDRLIGMLQPAEANEAEEDGDRIAPRLMPVGCAGRLTAFSETEDGRYLLTLTGLCRFRVREELAPERGYRRVVPDWAGFADDMQPEPDIEFDREAMITTLQRYFEKTGLSANWDAIRETDNERLITSLAMICPFEPQEKQALLEARNTVERYEIVRALLEMACVDDQNHEPSGRLN